MPRIYYFPKAPRQDARQEYLPKTLRERVAYVYRVHDRLTNVLLYVGCTNNPERRQLEHHFTKRYKREDVRYEIDPPMAVLAALAEERRQIAALDPLDNERGRPPAPGTPAMWTLRSACPQTWDARSWCQAWGQRVSSHGCRHVPGHDGIHECACGNRAPG